jgi:hypothetical protein
MFFAKTDVRRSLKCSHTASFYTFSSSSSAVNIIFHALYYVAGKASVHKTIEAP